MVKTGDFQGFVSPTFFFWFQAYPRFLVLMQTIFYLFVFLDIFFVFLNFGVPDYSFS